MSTQLTSVAPVTQYNQRETDKRTVRLQVKGLLRHFIGVNQLTTMVHNFLNSEESDFFRDKLAEVHKTISNMPATYEQDGMGNEAIVSLHYFKGGADWFITEKDKGCDDDAPDEKGIQYQAFGLADLFRDGGEIGYISIQELIDNNVELDLFWTPKTLGEVRAARD